MNKKITSLLLGVLVLVVLVISVWYSSNKNIQSPGPGADSANNTEVLSASSTEYTVLSFLKNSKNLLVIDSLTRGPDGMWVSTTSATSSIKLDVSPYELEIDKKGDFRFEDRTELYVINYDANFKTDYYTVGDLNYIGDITNGAFTGKKLFSYVLMSDGMMSDRYLNSYLIMIGENQYLQFKENDNTFSLKQPDYPETVRLAESTQMLKKQYTKYLFPSATSSIFFSDGLNFIAIDKNCVGVKMLDSRYMLYGFVYPIINENNPAVLNFTFNDGRKNSESYSYGLVSCDMGCSVSTKVDLPRSDFDSGMYKIIGKTPENKPVYTYTEPVNDVYQSIYDDHNTAAYMQITDSYTPLETSKYSYEEFLMYNPVLFWQDALGNWIKFANTRFTTIAEKCKPVIYLYPENKVTLNVQVTPNGGFTKTIPEYPVGGWNVEADPSGVIKDLLTSKIYPYLYWSGIGTDYPIDYNLGWLVKKSEVSGFLDEKLALLGLNDKETADFKEYWVPRLSVQEYYQIYFLTKSQIDRMDPLKVSPVKPDSIIRIMLTAKGLDAPVSLIPQVLPATPRRDGFTVVEWGGVLLR